MKTTALLIDDLDSTEFAQEEEVLTINWFPEGNLYFSNNGGVMGPYTVPQARRMWRDGIVQTHTQACWEGEDTWWDAGLAVQKLGDTENDRTVRGIGYILAAAGLFFLPVQWMVGVAILPLAALILITKGIKPAPRA